MITHQPPITKLKNIRATFLKQHLNILTLKFKFSDKEVIRKLTFAGGQFLPQQGADLALYSQHAKLTDKNEHQIK